MSFTSDLPVPAHWAIVELDEVADVQLGKMLDKKRTAGSMYPYVRNINVRWNKIDLSDLLEMPFKDREIERYSLEPSDVLVCEGGEPGRAAVWHLDDPTIKYQKALHRIRLARELLPQWLVFHLYFDAGRGSLTRHFTGTTIKHFPREAIRAYPLRIAPLSEQHRVVAALDSYFTRLEDAEATLERVQRNLERYRASVLQAAVEGRLVPTESAHSSRAPWSIESAEAVCSRVVSGSTPSASKMATGTGEVPFIKVYNLTMTGELDLSVKPTFISGATHNGQLRRSRTRPGDVLTNIVGPPLGKVSVVSNEYPEYNINQAIAAFSPSGRISTGWLRIVLGSKAAKRWLAETAKTTTSQVNLAITNCRRLPIPLPSMEDQAQIVAEVDRLLSITSGIEQTVARNLRTMRQVRQSILKWAFEGRLVDQDPTDEPASVLLERIRAERQAADHGRSDVRRHRSTGPQATRLRRHARDHLEPA